MENKLDLIADNSEDMKVSGRKLHMFLDVATRYNDWFSRMLEYGFEEGKEEGKEEGIKEGRKKGIK